MQQGQLLFLLSAKGERCSVSQLKRDIFAGCSQSTTCNKKRSFCYTELLNFDESTNDFNRPNHLYFAIYMTAHHNMMRIGALKVTMGSLIRQSARRKEATHLTYYLPISSENSSRTSSAFLKQPCQQLIMTSPHNILVTSGNILLV